MLYTKEIFISKFEFIVNYILSKREIKDSFQIQQAIIKAISSLVYSNIGNLILSNFPIIIDVLISWIRSQKDNEERGLGFETISKIIESLEASKLKPYVSKIYSIIFEVFMSSSQEVPSFIVKTLTLLLQKFERSIQEFINLISLIENLLSKGLTLETIYFLKDLNAMNFDGISKSILYRLLYTISLTLECTIKWSSDNNDVNDSVLISFKNNLKTQLKPPRPDKEKALALETLTMFPMPHDMQDLPKFVKEVVLKNLDSKNSLIRKAAARAGSMLWVKPSQYQDEARISEKLMRELVKIFLRVVLSDPSDETQITMLKSMNVQNKDNVYHFDVYLILPENLNKLFLCVRDPNLELAKLSTEILCRLSRKSPSEIVPFLKKLFFQLMWGFIHKYPSSDKMKELNLSILNLILKKRRDLLLPHTLTICKIVKKQIEIASPNLVCHLINTIGFISESADEKIIPYIDDLFPTLLEGLEDKGNNSRRLQSAKTLVTLVRSTGFVVIPYLKYPYLNSKLASIITNESHKEIRLVILRLMGIIGGMDTYTFQRIKGQLRKEMRMEKKRYTFEQLAKLKKLQDFNFIKKQKREFDEASKIKSQIQEELNGFEEDLFLLGNLKGQNIEELNMPNIIDSEIDEGTPTFSSSKEFEKLLNSASTISLNRVDYYYRSTIKIVLKIIWDESLGVYHLNALLCLHKIIEYLRGRTNKFLDIIIPVLSNYLLINSKNEKKNSSKISPILSIFELIFKVCGNLLSINHISSLTNIFLQYVKEGDLADSSLNLLLAMLENTHMRFKGLMEMILLELNSFLTLENYLAGNYLFEKTINCLILLSNHLDFHLPFFVSNLLGFLEQEINESKIKSIIWLITSLILNCPSIKHHISQLIHTLMAFLNKNSSTLLEKFKNLQSELMNTFVIIFAKFPFIFSQFLPQINNIIKAMKIYHNTFNSILKKIVNSDNISELENEREILELINNFTKQFSQIDMNFIEDESILQKKINLEKIKEEFDCSTKSLKEDWDEWLLKCMMVVIHQNPNPIIQVCASLAQIYYPFANEMFNISFASLWKCNLMNDIVKDFINKQFNKCIESPNTPNSVLMTILSLDEFMNHDKEGLHLDSFKMVDLAIRCGAYPKALYYREKELEVLSEDSFESLLYLYKKVGNPESGEGLLNNSSKFWLTNEKREIKILNYYSKLGRWKQIFDHCRNRGYEFENSNIQHSILELKIEAMHGLQKWTSVSKSCKKLMAENKFENSELLASMAADAEFFLGNWDSLENYTSLMPKEKVFESNYYSSVIALAKSDYEKVNKLIESCKESFDIKFSSLISQTTSESTAALFKLQELSELEEMLDLKRLEKRYRQELEMERKGEYVSEYERKKENIKSMFNDRTRLSEKNLINWQRLLVTRSLQLTVPENIQIYQKLAKLANRNGKYFICSDIMKKLRSYDISNGIKPDSNKKSIIPPKLFLISLEADFNSNVINDLDDFVARYQKFLVEISDKKLKAKSYIRLSSIIKEQKRSDLENLEIELISKAIESDNECVKAWHMYGKYHYEKMKTDLNSVSEAFNALMKSVKFGCKETFQDTLRLLGIIFKHGENEDIYNNFMENYQDIKVETWIDVIPQLSARLQIKNRSRLDIIVRILKHLANIHPQALIYVITVASKSQSSRRVEVANEILDVIRSKDPLLVKECQLVSEELNKVAILPTEMWKEGIGEAWRNYNSDKSSTQFLKILEGLHEWAKREPESMSDIAFHQYFGNEVKEAEIFLKMFKETKFEIFFHQAFCKYFKIYRGIETRTGDIIKQINLEYVSTKLLQSKRLNLIVPGSYNPNDSLVTITSFEPKLKVIGSKQRPRKLKIYGSNGKEYDFLLKGHEDLRQDERVMQLFSLVNKLVSNDSELEKKNLKIMKYSIIPLSTNTGMLGWVQNCDTIQQLIKEYREDQGIRPSTENWLLNSLCKNFDILPLINKVEIFRSILEETKGNDLQRVLWLKSPNSEIWLEKRTNYTRSLATMSMVGYILGLGDRHPSNIMLQRDTGKIVHIDFGDCWEVAMKRDKFPEKIPFRLTRMLIKAMDVSSIEGIYISVCEDIMLLLRSNKDSLLAVLEAFVYDPLLTWRLLTPSDEEKVNMNDDDKVNKLAKSLRISLCNVSDLSRRSIINRPISKNGQNNVDPEHSKGQEVVNANFREGVENENMVNEKALEVMSRITQKLTGTDFNSKNSIKDQVNRLIMQATSHENIAAGYLGWCPFW